MAYDSLSYSSSGTATIATDDIYKRVLTWHLYKGDVQKFSMQWLKNRVARFLNGANETDCAVLDYQPSVTVAAGTFTITIPSGANSTLFQQCVANGVLALPFQNSFEVET